MAKQQSLINFLKIMEGYTKDGYLKDNLVSNSEEEAPPLPLAYMLDEDEAPEEQYSLNNIAGEINSCDACSLSITRNRAVAGEGVNNPLLMVIGEGPGADEDKSGRPFVGRAGQLLDKMLISIGLSREENCFIANIVKCRPPLNRDPLEDEVTSCLPFLKRQITALNPKIILLAGRVAAKNLLNVSSALKDLRGNFHDYLGIPVLVTFHPSALLRDDSLKRPAWEDLKILKAKLEDMGHKLALL